MAYDDPAWAEGRRLLRPAQQAEPSWEEDTDVVVEDDIGTGHPSRIIVWNDDVNSFDWVIECFMDVLGHTYEQSDQLALIIHTKGKAIVKTGPKSELAPQCAALQDRGLSAELDEAE